MIKIIKITENKKLKKIILFLLSFALIFTPAAFYDVKPSAAGLSSSELQKQINEKQASINASAKKRKEIANKIANLKNEQSNAMKDKKMYDDMIMAIESEIKDTEDLIEYYKMAIEQEEEEILHVQEDYERSYSLFLDMIKFSYEQGIETDYLSMLLDSKNFTDFLMKIDIISTVIEYNKNIILKLQKTKETLVEKTENHDKAIKQLDGYIIDLSESSAEIEEWSAQAKIYIEKTMQDINANLKQQEAMAKEDKAMEDEIKALSAALKAQQTESQRKYVGGTFMWPLDLQYNVVTSKFGPRKSPITGRSEHHNSIDIRAPFGSKIYAANSGTVILSGYTTGYGNTIVIDHGGGKTTRYSHASSLLKKVGDKVERGDVVAKIGSTGWSTGYHLDLGLYQDGVPVNPLLNGFVKP